MGKFKDKDTEKKEKRVIRNNMSDDELSRLNNPASIYKKAVNVLKNSAKKKEKSVKKLPPIFTSKDEMKEKLVKSWKIEDKKKSYSAKNEAFFYATPRTILLMKHDMMKVIKLYRTPGKIAYHKIKVSWE